MPNCIWCDQRPVVPISWETFFEMGPRPGFCEACLEELERLEGRRLCKSCGRDLEKVEALYQTDGVCQDCLTWQTTEWGTILQRNHSVYTYNDFLKAVLTRYKFRGDALLIEGFRRELQASYRKIHKKRLAIPIPLSESRLKERSFNQALIIAKSVKTPLVEALIRVDQSGKQSKKSREERIENRENPFQTVERFRDQIKGKEVVLIDDIYTTGATLRLAAHALNQLGPKTISSFTLARG